jgi:hypothetical protein
MRKLFSTHSLGAADKKASLKSTKSTDDLDVLPHEALAFGHHSSCPPDMQHIDSDRFGMPDMSEQVEDQRLELENALHRQGQLAEAMLMAKQDLDHQRTRGRQFQMSLDQIAMVQSGFDDVQAEIQQVTKTQADDQAIIDSCRARLPLIAQKQAALQLVSRQMTRTAPKMLLTDVPIEATRMAEDVRKGLEIQLASNTTNIGVVQGEQVEIEKETRSLQEETEKVKAGNEALQKQQDIWVERQKAVQVDIERLEAKRRELKVKIDSIDLGTERMRVEQSKVSADVISHRQVVEALRSLTWQELGHAKSQILRNKGIMEKVMEEHEQRHQELKTLGAAHSKAIAESGRAPVQAPPSRVRIPLVEPGSGAAPRPTPQLEAPLGPHGAPGPGPVTLNGTSSADSQASTPHGKVNGAGGNDLPPAMRPAPRMPRATAAAEPPPGPPENRSRPGAPPLENKSTTSRIAVNQLPPAPLSARSRSKDTARTDLRNAGQMITTGY